MSKLQAAYLAGLIDGEGYIGILKCKKGNKKSFSSVKDYIYCPVLKIAMTDKPIITWLYQSYGGTFETRKAKGNANESYCWTMKNARVMDFLQKTYPYMRVKKNEAEIMFKFKNCTNGAGHLLGEENWTKRDELYDQLRQIHRRGTVRD